MTIAILKQAAGQAIPRPFNRATDAEELAEMLDHYLHYAPAGAKVTKAYAAVDSETPVLEIRSQRGIERFYGFVEF